MGCCGASVKNAASRHYSRSRSSLISKEEDMAKKAARKAKQDKVKADLSKEVPATPGAYYGNPIDKKQAKKLAAQAQKDAEETAERLAKEQKERDEAANKNA